MSVDFQRMQREYREDLNMRRNQELATLFERADRVIKQIADAEKFDLILQEAVYRSARIDITDRVLKALSEGK
jgi:outer membrane protein